MTTRNTNRPKRRPDAHRRSGRENGPEFRIVARSILAAFLGAPSPDVTVGEMTDMAIVLLMDEGYGHHEARKAIEYLSELDDSQVH